jgi:hypothetical protein
MRGETYDDERKLDRQGIELPARSTASQNLETTLQRSSTNPEYMVDDEYQHQLAD